jgi:hypothetical protein
MITGRGKRVCLLAALLSGFSAAAGNEAVLSFLIVDRHGEPTRRSAQIWISGKDYDKTVVVGDRGELTLPYGNYTITAWGGDGVSPTMHLEVDQGKLQAVIALSPRELGDNAAPRPWILRGTVSPPPRRGEPVIARLIGLYLATIEDATVADDGGFTLYPRQIGSYRLWILVGGNIAAEREIDVDFLPKVLPPVEIHIRPKPN